MEITRQQFEAYELVRESGATNMFMVSNVIFLARDYYGVELNKAQVLEIMQNYNQLKQKYGKKD